jgi:type I restriction enzyme S subunit
VKTIFDFYDEVPQDWVVHKFGDFVKERNERYSIENDAPVLSVTKYKGFVKSLEYFKKQIFSKDLSKYKLVKRGDFAYATIHLDEGSLGLLTEFERGYISPMYIVFRIDSSVNHQFFYYLMRTERYLQKYSAMGEGTVNRRKSISFENLSQLLIPLPRKEDQDKIVKILSNVDSLIQKTQKIIEQTQKLKNGLMQRLLTKGIGHTKFKEVQLVPRYFTTTIPETWEVSSLDKLAELQGGYSFKSEDYVEDGIRLLKISNVSHGELVWEEESFLPSTYWDEFSEFRLKKNDIIMAMTRPVISTGFKISTFNSESKCLLNQRVGRFIIKSKIKSSYLFNLLQLQYFVDQINLRVSESLQPNISSEEMGKIFAWYSPDQNEQEKISSVLSRVDSQIKSQQIYKSYLETLKKGLMQKLLIGQIRVKV